MISIDDYFMGRDTEFADELTDEIRINAEVTVKRANMLLALYRAETGDTEHRRVTSGWRPAAVNAETPGAAARSKHMTGQAIDISDPDGDLDEWCMANQMLLMSCLLWMEHPSATKGWVHWQTVQPKSGKRCFYP